MVAQTNDLMHRDKQEDKGKMEYQGSTPDLSLPSGGLLPEGLGGRLVVPPATERQIWRQGQRLKVLGGCS